MNAIAGALPSSGAVRTVLVIDDEPDIRQLVALSLSRIGIDTHSAANLSEARELLATYTFGACLTDMRLPDGNGVAFVAEVVAAYPDLPIAVITAHGQTDAAVQAMKNGAFDFVSKPVDLQRLRSLVEQAMNSRERNLPPATSAATARTNGPAATRAPTTSNTADSELVDGQQLVGTSMAVSRLREIIAKVARSNAPVWITGESGTGKELIARLLHRNSSRHEKPFIAVNCGAIPSDLMESELFGHCKGAFTGAHSDQPGLFRSAAGGSIFLDEIAELPLHMQVKLLRAIQERSVRPVGGTREHPVDVRFLSATHSDVAELVDAGRFRQDLYYRLKVIEIRSPPLRERRGDIEQLIAHVMTRSDTFDTKMTLDEDALELLRQHPFNGNIRELENILQRAMAMSDGARINAADLGLEPSGTPAPIDSFAKTFKTTTDSALIKEGDPTVLLAALEKNRWNRRRTAASLGLTYRQLRYRIAQFGLDDR